LVTRTTPSPSPSPDDFGSSPCVAPVTHGGFFLAFISESAENFRDAGPFTGNWQDAEVVMPRKGITGHDEWVITQALATALVALEQLPPKIQPKPHMEDLKKLLIANCQPGAVNLHLAQAKCRLLPDKDPLAIYQEYGIEGGRE
jgi:hypothetical protein